LPISRQIVEHFGGRLWLEPPPTPGPTPTQGPTQLLPPAPGACFSFWLPLQPPIAKETTPP
jgi:signal transduction histidine kinase